MCCREPVVRKDFGRLSIRSVAVRSIFGPPNRRAGGSCPAAPESRAARNASNRFRCVRARQYYVVVQAPPSRKP